jgi:hypothetical protein
MKKLFFLAFTFCLLHVTGIAQTTRMDGDKLIIRNTTGNTQKFLLTDTKTWHVTESVYIAPGESGTLYLKNSRKSVKNHQLSMVYDEQCYFHDLHSITIELERLRKQRQNRLIGEALFRALDQFFLKGKIGLIMDGAELLGGILNGKTYDDYVEDFERIAVENAIIDAMDGRMAKSLASASFPLLKLSAEEKFPEIENKIENNIRKLKNSTYITVDYQRSLSRYVTNEFHIDGLFPVSHSYKFEGIKGATADYLKHTIPYHVRLVNSWNQKFIGVFLSAAYGQSPLFYETDSDNPFFSNNSALSVNTIDVGAGLNYPIGSGSKTYWFFETGARSIFRNTYSFRSEETGTVENFTKNTTFEYDKSKFYLNIGLSISLKYFNIIGYYSYSGSKSDIWSSQVQVGLSVPLIRKYRYY